jgi:hypothetical protein
MRAPSRAGSVDWTSARLPSPTSANSSDYGEPRISPPNRIRGRFQVGSHALVAQAVSCEHVC